VVLSHSASCLWSRLFHKHLNVVTNPVGGLAIIAQKDTDVHCIYVAIGQKKSTVALVVEGHNAVKHIRNIVGATAPSDAAPGTIRGDFSFDTYKLADESNRPIQNLIHASGEVHEAEREIKIWFKDDELHAWSRIDEPLMYRAVGE